MKWDFVVSIPHLVESLISSVPKSRELVWLETDSQVCNSDDDDLRDGCQVCIDDAESGDSVLGDVTASWFRCWWWLIFYDLDGCWNHAYDSDSNYYDCYVKGIFEN